MDLNQCLMVKFEKKTQVRSKYPVRRGLTGRCPSLRPEIQSNVTYAIILKFEKPENDWNRNNFVDKTN